MGVFKAGSEGSVYRVRVGTERVKLCGWSVEGRYKELVFKGQLQYRCGEEEEEQPSYYVGSFKSV